MAWVYQVEEQLPDGSTYTWAMKELRSDPDDTHSLDEARALFTQEANILVGLDHPNLPKVAAFFESNGRVYLVMDFVQGESLAKRLEKTGAPLLPSTVLDWAIQICEVLNYLHSRKPPVIFRDLKPSNAMITPSGRIKLIDFGIARTFKFGQRRDTITMGSENYAAPEQWGEQQTDARADLYALGATMYHLLANSAPLPYFVPTPRPSLRQMNPAVSEAMAAVIDRAMAHNREARYQSAREMQRALYDCLSRHERRRMEQIIAEIRREYRSGPPQCVLATPQPALTQHKVLPTAAPARPALSRPATVPNKSRPTPRSAGAKPSTVVNIDGYVNQCPLCGAFNRKQAHFCRQCCCSLSRAPRVQLRIVNQVGNNKVFSLQDGDHLLGRRGGSLPVQVDLDYYDPKGYISRNHCRITVRSPLVTVTDLNSTNGTFINGRALQPVVAQAMLAHDRLRVGRIELELLLESNPDGR